MKYIYILIILSLLFSCGPAARQHRKEQKLARLLKENPALAKTDTTKVGTIINVPAIHDRVEIELQPDLQAADELMNRLNGKVDSSLLDTLNQGFKAILEHSGDVDTTLHTETSKIHIKKKGKKLTVDVITQPQPLKIEIPVAVTNINVPPVELRWYEKAFKWVRNTIGILGFSLLFLLLLYLVYRFIKALSA